MCVHGTVLSFAMYVVTDRKAPVRCAAWSIGSATSRMYRVYSSSFEGRARQKYTCASVAAAGEGDEGGGLPAHAAAVIVAAVNAIMARARMVIGWN